MVSMLINDAWGRGATEISLDAAEEDWILSVSMVCRASSTFCRSCRNRRKVFCMRGLLQVINKPHWTVLPETLSLGKE